MERHARKIQHDAYRRHLRVMQITSRDIALILRDAADDAGRQLRGPLRNLSSARLSRDQLLAVQRALRANQEALWGNVGRLTRAGMLAAMEEAALGHTALAHFLSEAAEDAAVQRQVTLAARNSAENVRGNVIARRDLSTRVYKNTTVGTKRAVQAVLRGVAQNKSAAAIAQNVRGLISPNTPGGVSYAARRLARTEINHSFHAVNQEMYAESPYVEAVRWELSSSHTRDDECNEYAESVHVTGWDYGLFLPNEVPDKPHPNCLCFTTAEVPNSEVFLSNLVAGKYGSLWD